VSHQDACARNLGGATSNWAEFECSTRLFIPPSRRASRQCVRTGTNRRSVRVQGTLETSPGRASCGSSSAPHLRSSSRRCRRTCCRYEQVSNHTSRRAPAPETGGAPGAALPTHTCAIYRSPESGLVSVELLFCWRWASANRVQSTVASPDRRVGPMVGVVVNTDGVNTRLRLLNFAPDPTWPFHSRRRDQVPVSCVGIRARQLVGFHR